MSASSATERFRVPLTIGWFGDFLVHPGLRVASSLPVLEGNGHAWLIEPGLGGYRHPGHSFGFFAEVLTGYRYTFDFGLYGEALAGVGYLHLIPDGVVYERADDGSMRKAASLGRPAVSASLAASVGWDLEQNGGPPLRLFLRPRYLVHAPHDGGLLGHVVGEAGLTWSF